MNGIKSASDGQSNADRSLTKDEIQREAAQEARFRSFEHGAPETGPGEDLYVDAIRDKSAGTDRDN